jgi:hypothetical protein
MSVVTVQEYSKTQNGNPKVKASGKWYFLNKSLDHPPMGEVEIKEGSFQMGNPPKSFPTIEAWRPVGANGASAPQHNAQAPAAAPAGDYIDEASMRFISNCVGSAITSGTIKEPGQILPWFQAAHAALKGRPADRPFDDSIPF